MHQSAANSPAEAISEALRGFGYTFEAASNCSDFRFHICTAPGEFWRAQMLVASDVVELYVYLTDARYLEQHQSLVLEMVCRLNSAVAVLGSYEFQWESGGVAYHSACDLRGQQSIAGAIERHLNAVKFPVTIWSKCYTRVGETKASASAIVNSVLIRERCHHGAVTDETRRMLLAVIEGGQSDKAVGKVTQKRVTDHLDILLREIHPKLFTD